MPLRSLLIFGAVLIVILIGIIPVAYVMGGRHATGTRPVEDALPTSSVPPSPASSTSPGTPPPGTAPAAEDRPVHEPATADAPAKAPSEPQGEIPADAPRSHAKGGTLGSVFSTIGDDAAAAGKHAVDDVDAQAHDAVAKARADAATALNKAVDHAAASVDSAADQLEQKAQRAIDAGSRAVLREVNDAAKAGTGDPAIRALVDGVAKEQAADAVALANVSAALDSDLAAAVKEVSTRARAYGESIKKLANPASLLQHGAPDEAAIARDIDKQAAQARAALAAFTTASEGIQHRCDETIAQLHQGMIDERARITAQVKQAAAAYDKQIAALRAQLLNDIDQALAATTAPLDDAQASQKPARPGR